MVSFLAETLDLSRLPSPSLVDVNFAAIKAQLIAAFVQQWEEERVKNPALPEYTVQGLLTDPTVILSEVFAYQDIYLRQSINEIANALRLATAKGADLDHLSITYHNTTRLSGETDTSLRERAQLSAEAFPLYGMTHGGYLWRVKRLFGNVIKDVRALKMGGGRVDLIVLSHEENGFVPQEIVSEIQGCFESEEAAQATDMVSVRSAKILEVDAKITVFIPHGPDPSIIQEKATQIIQNWAQGRHKIGETFHTQSLGAQASFDPVRWVKVLSPEEDVVCAQDEAPFLRSLEVTITHA